MTPSNVRVAVGVLAGGAWGAANLWCLSRLLGAWLGPRPSRGVPRAELVGRNPERPPWLRLAKPNVRGESKGSKALLWLLVKCPLLYVLAWMALRAPGVSPVGFGIGLTVVLAGALWWYGSKAAACQNRVVLDAR